MSSRPNDESAHTGLPTGHSPTSKSFQPSLAHAPETNEKLPAQDICTTIPLTIPVPDRLSTAVYGLLHLPSSYVSANTSSKNSKNAAAILLSGAGGGVAGPSGIYLSLADKLASLPSNPLPVLRLDYRFPSRTSHCVADVQAAMAYLESTYAIQCFILVGWSFGGAPVFTVAGIDKRVVGCATVASQTAETSGIQQLRPRPLLLLHGTADRTLTPECSRQLYRAYGAGGRRELRLFEGDDHSLSRNAEQAERLLGEFILRCAGDEVGPVERDILLEELLGCWERLEAMERGGDLRGGEGKA